MPSSVTQATLNYLARRLDELATAFPTSPAAVAVGTLADDVGVLTHHLQYATELAQERFTAPETVPLPGRQTLFRLAEAAVGIAVPSTNSPGQWRTQPTDSGRRPSRTSRSPICARTPKSRGSSPPRSTPRPVSGYARPPQLCAPYLPKTHTPSRGRLRYRHDRLPSRPPARSHGTEHSADFTEGTRDAFAPLPRSRDARSRVHSDEAKAEAETHRNALLRPVIVTWVPPTRTSSCARPGRRPRTAPPASYAGPRCPRAPPARYPRAGDLRRKDPHLSDHFRFGAHPEHGFVATATANIPAHLAHWYLEREQFEPVPDTPGLYRLIDPHHDGIRRTRQAVHDLRRHGYEVHADYALDPALTASPPQPALHNGLMEHRTRIAQAAATRSPQRPSAPATTHGQRMPQPAAVPVASRTKPSMTTHTPPPGTARRPGR
ncbi:hypothetical protein T261_0831 [Streptomyces lydicus]|nr:hypothetical protein T261_0831 [Streptomyces lydicus]